VRAMVTCRPVCKGLARNHNVARSLLCTATGHVETEEEDDDDEEEE